MLLSYHCSQLLSSRERPSRFLPKAVPFRLAAWKPCERGRSYMTLNHSREQLYPTPARNVNTKMSEPHRTGEREVNGPPYGGPSPPLSHTATPHPNEKDEHHDEQTRRHKTPARPRQRTHAPRKTGTRNHRATQTPRYSSAPETRDQETRVPTPRARKPHTRSHAHQQEPSRQRSAARTVTAPSRITPLLSIALTHCATSRAAPSPTRSRDAGIELSCAPAA